MNTPEETTAAPIQAGWEAECLLLVREVPKAAIEATTYLLSSLTADHLSMVGGLRDVAYHLTS